MKAIAFFDFDGTITTKDTMLELVRFHYGRAGYFKGMALISPWLVGLKLKLVHNQKAKEMLLKYFFGNMNEKDFNALCDRFSRERLPQLIRPAALLRIKELQTQGTEIIVVSASAANWVQQWCDSLNIKLIASELEIQDGRITGRLRGVNCHGNEKVRRIHNSVNLEGYTSIYCYGDTSGDKPMLELGTESFYRPFRGKLNN